ncbi:MAG: SH3 domain-containing protein [Lachnospiraceae bacterium]|nr:SH3 domain-containing protein [Lachnospiraceae bacterium]
MARKKKSSGVNRAADDVMRERARGTSSGILDFIVDHRRVILPVLVVLCLLLTVFIALRANRNAGAGAGSDAPDTGVTVPSEGTLALCEDPQVLALVNSYFKARETGDMETLDTIIRGYTEANRLQDQEYAKYVESYTAKEIYYKPGPLTDTWLVYVEEQVKFYDHADVVPGMKTLFVCKAEDESLYINEGTADEEVIEAIKLASIQDGDVVDMNNRINAAYNQMRMDKPDLDELISAISKNVTDAAAAQLVEKQNAEAQANASATTAMTTQTQPLTDVYLQAKEGVNIRKEASADSELVGHANTGQTFKLLAVEGDWSRIEYNGGEAFVKSEFFETTDGPGQGNGGIQPGEHTIATGCRVRAEANTESDILTETVPGDTIEVLEVLDSGWSKIEFDGETGYIMTEFIAE